MKSDACTKDVPPQSVHFSIVVLICSFHLFMILVVIFNKLYSSNWDVGNHGLSTFTKSLLDEA